MGLLDDITLAPYPAEPSRFQGRIPSRWNVARGPQGGVLAAAAALTARRCLPDPGHRLRTMTAMFSRSIPAGDLEAEVRVDRSGRTVTQTLTSLTSLASPTSGGPGPEMRLLAVFGSDRPDHLTFTTPEPPRVPEPSRCPPLQAAPDRWSPLDFAYWHNVESRLALGHHPWEDGWEPGGDLLARWVRYREPPVTADGTIDPVAFAPLLDSLPMAVSMQVGPQPEPFFAPSLDLTIHVLGPARDEWFLLVNRATWAADGYATATMEMWNADRLVAWATQLMFFARKQP